MNRHAWAVVAVLLGIALLYAAISHSIYHRTLPHHLIERFFGDDPGETWFSPRFYIRKSYSVIAFALLGAVTQLALPPSRFAILRGALAIACFSTLIEIGQKLHGAPEGLGWSAFDVGCGAAGGALGTGLVMLATRRRA